MSFGDIRVAARAGWLVDRIAATGSPGASQGRRDAGGGAGGASVFVLAARRCGLHRGYAGATDGGAMRRSARAGGAGHERDQFCRSRPQAARFWTGRGWQDGRLLHPPGDCDRHRNGSGGRAPGCGDLDPIATAGDGTPKPRAGGEGIGALAFGLRGGGRAIVRGQLGRHGVRPRERYLVCCSRAKPEGPRT